MTRMRSKDWWLGQTPEQQEAKAQARGELSDAVTDYRQTRATQRAKQRSKPGWLRAMNTITIWIMLPLLGFILLSVVGLAIGFVLALVINMLRRR